MNLKPNFIASLKTGIITKKKKINKIFVTIQHTSTITDLLLICSTHN